MDLFYKESKSKKNIYFFLGGEGGGARVSEYFYKESKSKKKLFFLGGRLK